MSVFVINSGNSSTKYRLINSSSGEEIASGLVERIGEETGHTKREYGEKGREIDGPVPDHTVGMEAVLSLFEEIGPSLTDGSIKTIGHHTIQGGKYFDSPTLVDDSAEVWIEQLCPLGPLHNPVHLIGIRVVRRLLPNVPHVVVLDTAFFQSLPGKAVTYAIDHEIAEKHKIRHRGAHGTSHQCASSRVSEILGRDDFWQIALHIGNGASVSTVVNGSAVETSMGFTPLESLVMGTRAGDIDPAVVSHLACIAGMDIDESDALSNRGSGLKGLTGQSDMHAVRILAAEGDENAIEALAVYAHRIAKYIDVYVAIMGDLDAIIFTAGAGENDADLRTDVIGGPAGFDVKTNADLNAARSKEPRILSTPDSTVAVLVVPMNEELATARQAMSLVG